MRVICAMAVAAVAAAQEARKAEPPVPTPANDEETKALDQRIDALEREVQTLRLRAEDVDSEAPPAAAATTAPSANVFNPTITAIGNGVYRWDDRPVLTDDGARIDRRFLLRDVELDMRAAVDPFADGLAIVAFAQEAPDEFAVEVEETYVTIKSLPVRGLEQPPLGLKLRVGRFLTETGRINRLHTHDLPHTQRPLAVTTFLGDEGFAGEGASAQMFVPFPFDDESAVELTAQAVRGGGSAIAAGGTNEPAYVAHLRWFRTFADAHSVDLAGIAHEGALRPDGGARVWLFSADALYKWKPLRGGEFRSFVLAGQAFWARTTRGDERPRGWFAWAQVQPLRSIYLGGRYDQTSAVDDDAFRRRAASGYVSWYTSEFLRLRGGYERRVGDLLEENGRDSVFCEINFVFGSHPSEPFWVNR
ncbi:MAG: hypothetical protein AABZ30_11040 [Myxococcota bacterium]